MSKEADPGLQHLLKKLKGEIKSHGGSGFLGLQRKFRIISNDDGNSTINFTEFKKAMKEIKMTLNDRELRMLFEFFDEDGSGEINFDEFIKGLRDPLNKRRHDLVQLAWSKIDRNGDGNVDVSEIESMYDVSKHPDVKAGKITPEQALRQFLSVFEGKGNHDGSVSREEFEDYYTNLGANIDNDDNFELIIRNAWHISGGTGWSANSSNKRVLVKLADGTERVEEIKDDLGLRSGDKQGTIARLRAQGTQATNYANFGFSDDRPQTALPSRTAKKLVKPKRGVSTVSRLLKNKPSLADDNDEDGGGDEALPDDEYELAPVSLRGQPSPGLAFTIQNLKDQIKRHGGGGFLGLQRKFRIISDGDNTVNLAEFKKAMRELKINLSDTELRMLFDFFDKDRSDGIDFDEFICGLRDPLNKKRLAMVDMAWGKIDSNGDGTVDLTEVAALYDVSKLPDVRSGKITPQEAYRQFLSTFEDKNSHDGTVTKEEFVDYYTNLGANIDNDDYFELMIRNAWHISGGSGWAANSSNKRVLVTRKDGRQTVEEIQNDLGLRAGDKNGISGRLRAQGLDMGDVEDVGTSYGNEDKGKGKLASTAPQRTLGRGALRPSSANATLRRR